MKDIEANEIADKLGLRLVGIVAEIIATDKRLAESIAAIIYEKIGDRLADIEMTMGLINEPSIIDDKSNDHELKSDIYNFCKKQGGKTCQQIFSSKISYKLPVFDNSNDGRRGEERETLERILCEMLSDGIIKKRQSSANTYKYESVISKDIF